MFQPNSRIEQTNGIRFYEQDILFDDRIYSNDIKIDMTLDYLSPGIGIALMNNEGVPLQEQNEIFLFKLGFKELTILQRFGDIIKKINMIPSTYSTPKESMYFSFSKIGRRVSISLDDFGTVLSYVLPIDMDKYNIGIYSNAGNVIKHINIASSIPDSWNINMRNTNGGHLKFIKDGFVLENCNNFAEIEQPSITLPAGKYYVKYNAENSDIVSYVIEVGDERLSDEEKNLLLNGSFTLEDEKTVNLKFKGTHGQISKIHLTDQLEDRYASTRDKQAIIEGSSIIIDMKDITELEWKCKVSDISKEGDSIIAKGDNVLINWATTGLLLNTDYLFKYDVSLQKLSVFKPNIVAPVFTFIFNDKPQEMTILKNMDCIVQEFKLYNTSGETINLIVEKTTKKYVPASICSPILALDDTNNPLDLSSSFRIINEQNDQNYYFTNWEREIFKSESHLKLEKRVSLEVGSVKVYGIPKGAAINKDKLYEIKSIAADDISMYCQSAVMIKEKELQYLDKVNGELFVYDSEDYDLIIVDYLKSNSYAINYMPTLKMYEVDISTTAENVTLLYDRSVTDGIEVINDYKITGIPLNETSYVVLRREGF